MAMTQHPIQIASVGLGNYAKYVASLLLRCSRVSVPSVQLTAVCEPELEKHPDVAATLREAGVKLFAKFDDMLNEPVDAVWLPIPIALHRPFTLRALAAGKAVMVEKPAAGVVEDVDAMIAARDAARLPVAVGFHSPASSLVSTLRRDLCSRRWGAVKRVVCHSAGSRGDTYYARSRWAGKLRDGDAWVLDSPATNAHAHDIHLAMHLLGSVEGRAAVPVSVEAELYRGNPIESFDTCGLRVVTDAGVECLFLMTHACEFFVDAVTEIECERGRATLVRDRLIIEKGGHVETTRAVGDARERLVERFANLVRGNVPCDELAALEDARAQVAVVNGAMEVAPILDIPDAATRWVDGKQGRVRAVIGMEAMIAEAARLRRMPNESGLFDWTQPPRSRDLRGYDRFQGVVRGMSQISRFS